MAGPSWIRLDTGYLTNPKMRRLDDRALLLHLASVLYLGAHGIDSGLLPADCVELLRQPARVRGPMAPVVRRLLDAGLWHEALGGTAYLVHDYDELNGTRSTAYRDRMRKRAERKGGD